MAVHLARLSPIAVAYTVAPATVSLRPDQSILKTGEFQRHLCVTVLLECGEFSGDAGSTRRVTSCVSIRPRVRGLSSAQTTSVTYEAPIRDNSGLGNFVTVRIVRAPSALYFPVYMRSVIVTRSISPSGTKRQ